MLDEKDREDKEESVPSNEHKPDAFKNVLTLDDRDVSLILKENMLNDTVIQFFQSLFGGINGLQDPLLGKRLSFKVARNPFIEVLHDGRCHWVTVSTFGCNPDEINCYDSLFKGKITDSGKKQIYNLLRSKEKKIKVHVMPVQQQKNNIDCGICAIAFAYFIANNTDPSIISLDETKLRKYLYFCFQNCKMAPFSLTSNERKNKEKIIFLNLYCNCRMSWSNFDGGNFDMQMVKCDVCFEWFHRKCERILDIAFSPNVNWEFHQCKQIS